MITHDFSFPLFAILGLLTQLLNIGEYFWDDSPWGLK